MGKKDIVSNAYMEDPERFADLINGYIYHGEKIVSAEDVQEKNRSDTRIYRNAGGLTAQIVERDVKRLVGKKLSVMIVALENQSDVHYAMPLRVMNGDSVNYYHQWRQIRREHEEKADLTGAELLSGFAKTDHLMPTVTIVLYFGKERWDGPRRLWDMVDFGEKPEDLKAVLADHPINLLEVRYYEYLEYFRTDLRYVFGFLQKAEAKQELKSYIDENRQEFTDLKEDAYDFISVMSGTEELDKLKDKYRKEEGAIDMCRAIREMMEDSRAEGKAEGKAEAILDFLQDLGSVPETVKVRISAETDTELLKHWLKMAAREESLDSFLEKWEKEAGIAGADI